MDLTNRIAKINKYILTIEEENYDYFYVWFEDYIFFHFEEVDKEDVKRSYLKKIKDD